MPRDLVKLPEPEVETRPDLETKVREYAAHIIERDGWWNGNKYSHGHCFLTATNLAISELGLFIERDDLLDKIVGPSGVERVAAQAWNDAAGRTKEQVIQRLRVPL